MNSKNKKVAGLFLSLVFCAGMWSCSGSGIETASNNPLPNNPSNPGSSVPQSPKLESLTKNAFLIGSTYPADIDIIDQPGLEDVAFITTSSTPPVIAVDLNSNPLKLSTSFKGLQNLPPSAGYPNNLWVVDATHALLLTSSSLILFNPTDSSIYQNFDLSTSISLSSSLSRVDGQGNALASVSGSFTPSFPASLAMVGSKVVVSFSNLKFSGFSLSEATQGIVRVFDLQNNQLSVASPVYFPTSGYNTTGITALQDGSILVTNTGLTKFTPDFSNQLPVTAASVDRFNPATGLTLGNLNLGFSTPAFHAWAVTPDQKRAFIGSASGGYLLEVGLDPFTVLHGVNNPIVITDANNGTDYMSDAIMGRLGGGLYVTSFNHSKVYALDLTTSNPTLISQVLDLNDPSSPGGVTGAGPLAQRPGTPSVDFTGVDLFILTGNPGTMAAAMGY